MKFSLRHPYAIEPDAFWREVFFDPAYNEALYREGLHFEAFKVLDESNPPDGRRTRKLAVKPKLDAPAAIKKVLGEQIRNQGRLSRHGEHGDTEITENFVKPGLQESTSFFSVASVSPWPLCWKRFAFIARPPTAAAVPIAAARA